MIACNSCKSKYLVNSADLKPNGRYVQCTKCGNQWFQESLLDIEEKDLDSSVPPSGDFEPKINQTNLPSTYVKEQKVSILNSILAVLALIFLFITIWLIKNLEINSLVLFNYYINEFYFNLKLIVSDLMNIFYQIIN